MDPHGYFIDEDPKIRSDEEEDVEGEEALFAVNYKPLSLKRKVTSLDDINVQLEKGTTYFSTALKRDHIAVVKALMTDPSLRIDIRDDYGRMPIHSVCEKGNVNCLKLLLRDIRVDLDIKTDPPKPAPGAYRMERGQRRPALIPEDKTCIRLAYENKHYDVVSILLAFGELTFLSLKEFSDHVRSAYARRGNAPRTQKWATSRSTAIAEDVAIMNVLDHGAGPGTILFKLHCLRDQLANERKPGEFTHFFQQFAAETFALMVLLSDNYYRLHPSHKEDDEEHRPYISFDCNIEESNKSALVLTNKKNDRQKRFFSITTRVPMEIQMRIASFVNYISQDYIPKEYREKGIDRQVGVAKRDVK